MAVKSTLIACQDLGYRNEKFYYNEPKTRKIDNVKKPFSRLNLNKFLILKFQCGIDGTWELLKGPASCSNQSNEIPSIPNSKFMHKNVNRNQEYSLVFCPAPGRAYIEISLILYVCVCVCSIRILPWDESILFSK